jgi:hypothetical protein
MILARRALHAAQMAAERHRTTTPQPSIMMIMEVVSVPAGTCGRHRIRGAQASPQV